MVNRKVVGLLALLGAVLIGAGLVSADFAAEAWGGVFVELGAGVGLVGVLVVLEAHVIAQAEHVAETAVTTKTRGLDERVTRLEEIDAAAAEILAQDRAREADLVKHIATSTGVGIGELVSRAAADTLIDEAEFCVRAGSGPNAETLYIRVLRDAGVDVDGVMLDFEPIKFGIPGVAMNPQLAVIPTDSLVHWTTEGAPQIGAELVAGLQRRNQPVDGFGFAFALEQFQHSLDVMRAARNAPVSDPRRLVGRLHLLINTEWAITTFGLESLTSDRTYRATGPWDGGFGVARWVGLSFEAPAPPDDDPQYAEAVEWVTGRGWRRHDPTTKASSVQADPPG